MMLPLSSILITTFMLWNVRMGGSHGLYCGRILPSHSTVHQEFTHSFWFKCDVLLNLSVFCLFPILECGHGWQPWKVLWRNTFTIFWCWFCFIFLTCSFLFVCVFVWLLFAECCFFYIYYCYYYYWLLFYYYYFSIITFTINLRLS